MFTSGGPVFLVQLELCFWIVLLIYNFGKEVFDWLDRHGEPVWQILFNEFLDSWPSFAL